MLGEHVKALRKLERRIVWLESERDAQGGPGPEPENRGRPPAGRIPSW